jgi:FkbM family methyltransferase
MNYLKRYGPSVLIAFIVSESYARVWRRLVLHSFSQSGEDLVLDRLTGHKKRGFYVDVGAYDPYRFSNTMRFYLRGWRGINIEPDTQRWSLFRETRARDINLNIGVAEKRGNLTYFRMDPPTLSTFELKQAKAYVKQGFPILDNVKVPVLPLSEVFRKYLKNQLIDFMSVDVEGWETTVLASNDWKKFRPRIICIESADFSKTKLGKQNYLDSESFLKKAGYRKIFDNGLNSFYEDTKHG